MNAEVFAPRVAEGGRWLDRRAPGWAARIDLSRLELNDCNVCVLGQMFGSYWDVVDGNAHRFGEFHNELTWAWAGAHGFNVPDEHCPDDDPRWLTLRECWVTEILARQFASLPAQVAEPQPVAVER